MDGLDIDPTWEEVQRTIKRMKSAKAPGPSGLPAEWFKVMLDEPLEDGALPQQPTHPMQKCFFLLMLRMWQLGHIPQGWAVAELVSIGKKGDLTLRDNYRGISLIEVIVKILTKLVTYRISTQLERLNRLAIEQAGFRIREECMGQTVALLETLHRRSTTGKGTILLFIDLRKAYDMVDHDALLYKLECIGVTERALRFLGALYSSSASRIRAGTERSRVIKLGRGCRQGCPGSPPFFDVFINDLAIQLRETGVEVPGVEEGLGSLLFADDVVVLTSSAQQLGRACEIVTAWANKWGMEAGVSKCGLMVVNSEDLKREVELEYEQCTLQGDVVPWVDSYDYLGVKLTEAELPSITKHVEERCSKFKKRWTILYPFLRSHSIPIWMRRRILLTVCLPVLRWGSEVMGPAKDSVKDLSSAYHTALKGIVGSRSKNTIYSMLTVRRELNVPSFQELIIVSRARALKKYPTLSTWVAKILENPWRSRKHGWMKSSEVWLKKYPQVNPGDDLDQAIEKIGEYFRNTEEASHEGQAVSFLRYKLAGFEGTRCYLKSAIDYPKISVGVTWLLRLRVGGIWTAHRAAKRELIDEAWLNKCPACGINLTIDEIAHVVLLCPEYVIQRQTLSLDMEAVLTAALDSNQKLTYLAGGNLSIEDGANGPRPPFTEMQWSGEKGETIEGLGKPGFVPVAEFLQRVMPAHMRALWGLKL